MNSHNQPILESNIMARILRRGGRPDIIPGTQNLTQATTTEVMNFLTHTDPRALAIFTKGSLKKIARIYDALIQTVPPDEARERFEQLASIEHPPYRLTPEHTLEEFKEFQARVKKILNPDSEKLAA